MLGLNCWTPHAHRSVHVLCDDWGINRCELLGPVPGLTGLQSLDPPHFTYFITTGTGIYSFAIGSWVNKNLRSQNGGMTKTCLKRSIRELYADNADTA